MFNLRGFNVLFVGLALFTCVSHCDVIRKTKLPFKISDQKQICYFGSWAEFEPISEHYYNADMNVNKCVSIAYSFALKTDNKIAPTYPTNGKTFEQFVKLKETNPELLTMIAVGGLRDDSQNYMQTASTKNARSDFLKSVVSYMSSYNFDGLELLWEPSPTPGATPEERENYDLLVSKLQEVIISLYYNRHKVIFTNVVIDVISNSLMTHV